MAEQTQYRCYASTRGNPDFNQYAPVSDPEWFEASSLDELRARLRGYMEFWDVGGGNWNSPVVYQGKKKLGYLSYNLRLWNKRDGEVIDEPTNRDVIEYDLST
mgnify:CR=1 FL=1